VLHRTEEERGRLKCGRSGARYEQIVGCAPRQAENLCYSLAPSQFRQF